VPDEDRNGIPNSSFNFSGTSDWIQLNIGPSYFSQDFSLALWIKLDDFQAQYPAIINGDLGYILLEAAGPLYIPLGHYQQIKFYQYNRPIVSTELWSANTFQTNQWYHLAIVRSGLDFSMYVNGSLSAEITVTNSFPLVGNYLQVGNDLSNTYGGAYFHGNLDELRIYNRALSASEIQTLYQQTQGASGWLIKTYWNGSPVNGLADADTLINGGFVIAVTNMAESDMVGFSTGEGTGHFSVNKPVPGIPNNVATDSEELLRKLGFSPRVEVIAA
jgi:Concanavalin A-like lectin/glucanases superfamily